MGWELFQQYVRALHEAQPKYFIYENNKSMSPAIRKSISDAFGFEPVLINSALVSAQNRNRLYWVGIRNDDGTYRKVNVEQPEDRGILLRDILDYATSWMDKSHTIDATYYKGGSFVSSRPDGTLHQNSSRHMVAEPVRIPPYGNDCKSRPVNALYPSHSGTGEGSLEQRMFSDNPSKQQVDLVAEPVCLTEREMDYMVRDHADQRWNFCQRPGQDEKGKCVVANVSKGVPYNVVAEPIKVGSLPRPNGELSTSQASRIYSQDGKSVTLCAGSGGLGGKTGLYAIRVMDGREQKLPIYKVENGQIEIKGRLYPIKLDDGFYIIRKLTVSECMRLQTVPDWYEFPVSNTQAYKMLGNGWTVEVIVHLINSIRKESVIE